MVDALRRAHRWLRPHGCVIDIHPTALASTIEVGGRIVGSIQTADAPARHAAAAVAADGLFVIAGTDVFDFYTHADSLSELRDHIDANWRDACVRADAPDAEPVRAHEQVRITKLCLARDRV